MDKLPEQELVEALSRIEELEADNAKLREELQHRDGMNLGMVSTLYGKPFEYWFELEAENAKLRKALETIRDSGLETIDEAYRWLAATALEGKGGG